MKASHKGNDVMFGFTKITLERGQFISGRRSLAEIMNKGIKNNRKLSTSSWERRLKLLQNMGKLNLKVNHQYTIISVTNYDTYQTTPEQSEPPNEPRVNHERTTSEPLVNTNKNVKTVKNAENGKDKYPVDFNMFWSVYPKKTAKQTALRAWNKLGSARPSVVDLVEAIEEQKTWDKWRQGFIYNPATWLNGHCWEDEKPDEPEPPKSDYQKRMERIEDEYNKGN